MPANKILIIGSSSNIGKNFALLNNENSICIPFNIRKSKDLLFDNIKCNIIINFASINPFTKNNDNYIEGNCLIAESILNIAKKFDCRRLINISAMSIFNGSISSVVSNKTIPAPLDLYSFSKLLMENKFNNSELDQVINIRLPSVVYLENDNSILSRFIEKIKNNKDLYYYNPYSKFNNIINVENIYSFIKQLINMECKNRVNYNLGANNPLLIIDLLESLKIKYNSNSKLIENNLNLRNSFFIDLEVENKIHILSDLIDYI